VLICTCKECSSIKERNVWHYVFPQLSSYKTAHFYSRDSREEIIGMNRDDFGGMFLYWQWNWLDDAQKGKNYTNSHKLLLTLNKNYAYYTHRFIHFKKRLGWAVHWSLVSIHSSNVFLTLIKRRRNVSWAPNQHIRMISEGSCDTEDQSNGCWNFILNCNNISLYYCIFIQYHLDWSGLSTESLRNSVMLFTGISYSDWCHSLTLQ